MISDEDAIKFYRGLNPPGVFGKSPFSLQIFRGVSAYRREPVPGGCQRHFGIFEKHQVIPEYCFSCYKVLIEPRTVMEHFKLMMIMDSVALPTDNRRKCMIELRAGCSGAYKGYVYCRGREDGELVFELLRKAIAGGISPDVPVSLKRGCSEFAAVYPEYPKVQPGVEPMQYNGDWRVYEEEFDRTARYTATGLPGDSDAPAAKGFTPSEVFALTFWLGYAATIGDDAYQPIAGCTLLPIPGLNRPPLKRPG